MGLNDTVSAERVHISFFGMRNAGKSSLVNAVTGQELAVVSDVKGTTTDPVRKAMEILPLGPVVIIDTPGIDDEGELGEKRVQKARQVLTKTDIAVLVVDSTKGLGKFDNMMIDFFKDKKIPFVIAYNKSDLLENVPNAAKNEIYVSAKNDKNVYELKEIIASFCKMKQVGKDIVADVLEKGDTVILVIPIDESAPKGRVILPQQQVLRELLDNNCTAVCCQVTELDATIKNLIKRPKLVITDSQAFEQVSAIVPEDIGLTSFSIDLSLVVADNTHLFLKGVKGFNQSVNGILQIFNRSADFSGAGKFTRFQQYNLDFLFLTHSGNLLSAFIITASLI